MRHNLSLLIKYTRDFISHSRMKIVRLILYTVATGFTQGVGVFMLVPFLSAIGAGEFAGSSVKSNRIFELSMKLFHFFNLPLNLISVLSVFIALIVFVRFINYRQSILTADIQNSYVSSLQTGLFRSVIFADWRFIADQRSSNITHVITNDLPSVSTGTFFFLRLLTGFVISIVYIAWAMLVSVELTVFIVFFAALSFVFIRVCLPYSMRAGIFARGARAKIYELLLDHLHGLKTAKSYGAEQREYLKFQQAATEISRTHTGMVRLNSRTRNIYSLVINIMLCVFLYVSLSILKVPLASLLLLIVIFSRLLPSVQSFQNDIQHLFTMLPAFEATEALRAKADLHQENIYSDSNPAPLELRQGIRLRNLCFSYQSADGSFAVAGLDLEIPALKTTAIIGESGIGKSTIADIITGILKPDSGEISVDSTIIDNRNLRQWRQSVGYLPQEDFLFHDTIRNNILWGKPEATDEEINEALQRASADHFVSRLPKGLDTVVKDRGIRLSGGERQRIALARTLIRKPRLLLLDEATSNLDAKNESKIYDSISKLHGKMTIVYITHRAETLKFADKTVNLNELFLGAQPKS